MKKSLILAAALVAGTAAADEQAGPLVKDLGSANYATRNSAHRALSSKTDQDTTDKLLQAMKSSDPEVARRAQAILTPYLEAQKEQRIQEEIKKITQECGGMLPQGDLAPLPDGVFWQYFEKSEGTTSDPEWSKYRAATRLLILDLLRDGQDPRPFIEAAKEGENRWWEQRNAYSGNRFSIPFPPKK